MEKKIPSWKTLFQITEALELAALRKDARSHNRLYGSLTFSQSRVCVALIRLLEKQPSGVSLKELAAELKISPGATSELVEELVRKGIVSRTQNENDRRSVSIRFLDNVMALHQSASREIERTYRKMLDVLSGEEQREWERLLETIIKGYHSGKGQN